MRILNKGLEILYPSNIYCISCGSIIDKTRPYALCDHCVQKFHWLGKKTCAKCGKILQEESRESFCSDCQTFPHFFEKGYTCAQYGLYERALMMDYKYRKKSYIGRKLGEILYDRIRLEKLKIDLIAAVPIHKKKYQTRGYNQAAIMARYLADKMEVPYAEVLIRTKNTSPMRGLNPVDRQENLRDAFGVSPQNHYSIVEKVLLLIDDIYTTGSTLDACSQSLLEAGAQKVFVLTFAAGADLRKR